MTTPYPTNHKRIALPKTDFDAIDRAITQGRNAESQADNPHFYRTAIWIAWEYGWTTREVERVVA